MAEGYYAGFKTAQMSTKQLFKHAKCCGGFYPHTQIKRLAVPADLINWDVAWHDYNPPEYNSKILQGKSWADPALNSEGFYPKWNNHDGNVNRISYHGPYKIVNGFPLNPCGRTGLAGRGILGKWGPNHAADPIVTRWKRNNDGSIINQSDKPILQVCVIQRADCAEWAFPGGMIDPGEKISITLKREFMEEAMNSLDNTKENNAKNEKKINELFASGVAVYNGYVDDPRNTDNAWMETSAINYHDDTGSGLGSLKLEAGDDAKRVKWTDVNGTLKLYASHGQMLKKVADRLQCFW